MEGLLDAINILIGLASIVILFYASTRRGRIRSFATQLSIIVILLVVAELLRLITKLGLADLGLYQSVIHSVALYGVGIILIYRVTLAARIEAREEEDFKSIILKCVVNGMSRVIGESALKSITLYMDLDLIIDRPEVFERTLYTLVRGDAGDIIRNIMDEIVDRFNIDVSPKSLGECIRMAHNQFHKINEP